jgi:hypothetical protein
LNADVAVRRLDEETGYAAVGATVLLAVGTAGKSMKVKKDADRVCAKTRDKRPY